jgi:hypothetical protein
MLVATGGREVVETAEYETLNSMNNELLVLINSSEQQELEAQQLRGEWLQEKDEMSNMVELLRSSVEREVKEREKITLEVF